MIRLFDIAKERGRSMDELLQYDVCSTSPLFDEEGLMTKATKSQIVQELEKHLDEDCPKTPTTSDSAKTGYIVDVMANVRKIKQKDSSNFGEFCDSFLRFIQSSAKGTSRIDFVFDSYMDRSIRALSANDWRRNTPSRFMMYRGKRLFLRKWTDSGHQSETKRSLNHSSTKRL